MITVIAPDGAPEVARGDDLVSLLLPLVDLVDGDIVTITSKVVSKSEGRQVTGQRPEWVARESARQVAARGTTRIVRNRLGLTMAAAGVDASNVAAGTLLLLPIDPDATARRIRSVIAARTGCNVGVIITDTAGRAWRHGQTDIAIGVAGVTALESFAGRADTYGNDLVVTAPAVADEIASTAELASGKLGGRPFAVIRGRADLVLPPGHDGLGAVELIRDEGTDLFGYGAREAVIRAIAGRAEDAAPFGAAVSAEELIDALQRAGFAGASYDDGAITVPGAGGRRDVVGLLGFAHGWQLDAVEEHADPRLQPTSP